MDQLARLGIPERLRNRLVSDRGFGFSTSTSCQAATWEAALGKDKSVLLKSPTGTGKTIAFLVPLAARLVRKLDSESSDVSQTPLAIVCCPHSQLAEQITDVAKKLLDRTLDPSRVPVTTLCLDSTRWYRRISEGVSKKNTEIHPSPANLIIGTPHAVLKYIQTSKVSLKKVETCVFDEADSLFDEATFDQGSAVKTLCQDYVPRKCRFIVASATLGAGVDSLRGLVLHAQSAVEVNIESSGDEPIIEECLVLAKDEMEKHLLLYGFLTMGAVPLRCLVFVNSDKVATRLWLFLNTFGTAAEVVLQCMSSAGKDAVVKGFSAGRGQILIFNDLGLHKVQGESNSDSSDDELQSKEKERKVKDSYSARGLDIPDLQSVVNMDPPIDVDAYLHRAGRCGRAGDEGIVLNIGMASRNSETGALVGDAIMDELMAMRPKMFAVPEDQMADIAKFRYRVKDVFDAVNKNKVIFEGKQLILERQDSYLVDQLEGQGFDEIKGRKKKKLRQKVTAQQEAIAGVIGRKGKTSTVPQYLMQSGRASPLSNPTVKSIMELKSAKHYDSLSGQQRESMKKLERSLVATKNVTEASLQSQKKIRRNIIYKKHGHWAAKKRKIAR